MTVKEYLNQPYIIEKKVEYLNRELKRYERMMYSVSSPQFDAIRVDKSPSNTTCNQRALEKYYETKEKIKEKEVELKKVVENITDTIDKLESDEYKLVLKLHYIDHKSITEIAEDNYICLRTAQRWHKEAQIIIEKLIMS